MGVAVRDLLRATWVAFRRRPLVFGWIPGLAWAYFAEPELLTKWVDEARREVESR